MNWEVLNNKKPGNREEIINILLKNRGIKTKAEIKEFFNPVNPDAITLNSLGIKETEVKKALERINKAIAGGEQIVIYGDYDADGICSSAVLWECLYKLTKNVIPYLPDRFAEGYGINPESVVSLKSKYGNLKLIITVDNGIVAEDAVKKAGELGIDVIVTDHHQPGKKYPDAYSVIHTDKISGSGIAWVFAREIRRETEKKSGITKEGLELAAIGTIADQLPLTGANRSIAGYGISELRQTGRPGLLALFEESGIDKSAVGTYEINYLIAPRLNAMGRIKSAMDSLRLLCTTNFEKAKEYAVELGKTNRSRQQIVDQVVMHARTLANKKEWSGVIVLADESYHEGVIGLAAGKLVEEFGRPAIVLSKGIEVSKASARSVTGFNIIENIRKMDSYIIGGGGHPMAAGFTIETAKIESFIQEFNRLTEPLLSEEILRKKIKIDCIISFNQINTELFTELRKFEPSGLGNFTPVFMTEKIKVVSSRTVGSDGKHLKLKLEKDNIVFDAIAFNMGGKINSLSIGTGIDVAFNLDENEWNGSKSLQLKVKDIHLEDEISKNP